MLEIKDLSVSYEEVQILKGLNLRISPGEKHVIMGPNGAGKSTLAKILMGDSLFKISSGSITLFGNNLLDKEPEERAADGLFVSFQNPPEIPGLPGNTLLFESINQIRAARKEVMLTRKEFYKRLSEVREYYSFKESELLLLERPFNEGCSGGEKKKNEILQMLVTEPLLSVLDEPDSGLDVDAMKFVCSSLNRFCEQSSERALIFITHYPQVARYLSLDYVHILSEGRIAITGGADLIPVLEAQGYEGLLTHP